MHYGLYRAIRERHWQRWREAMRYLWSLTHRLEIGSLEQSEAIEHLRYLQQQLEADEIIERNQKGASING